MANMATPANKNYPDMTKCSVPQLTAYMSNYFLDAGLLQLTVHSSTIGNMRNANGFLYPWPVPA